jgi:arsenite methyltransferase
MRVAGVNTPTVSRPGLLAAEIAAAVGPDGLVCGIDSSDSMLALARARTTRPNSAPMELRQAGADRLPYAQASFDVAVATQVLEYVKDVPDARAEIHRVLRPGGRVLVLDTDWDSIVWRSSDEERMARVLAAWDHHLVDPHLPRRLRGWLERAGFQVPPPQVVPLCNVGVDPATYSAGLLDFVAGFVVGRDGLTAEEVQAWRRTCGRWTPTPSSASTATCSAR